ncbi:riboflavin kinase-like [Lytechinus pictus]|uniref:riboflavin kinase-like n=1 Tax=Lytechinus pictus TaxID=7653 RepID=UPI00240D5C8B|nr:riboflavin kinase-like [Lytechinus pictus]
MYMWAVIHLPRITLRCLTTMAENLPYFTQGRVIKGFGRGSKELGIPTANFPEDVVEKLPAALTTGVYYGWACVDDGEVHKMVMSIGWNPYYKNEKKSMETHIMHTFKDDFYDSILKVGILGFMRPEKNYPCLDSLIAAIKQDIADADMKLSQPDALKYKNDNFFRDLSSQL